MSSIAPRELVPTKRQRDEGLSPAPYDFIPTEASSSGRKVWRSIAAFDPRKISGPKIPIFVFVTVALLGHVDEHIYTVIVPELRAEFASAPATLGIIAVAVTLMQYVTMPLYGWLADRIKRVYLVRLAHVGGNLVSALSAFAAHPVGIVGARGGAGLLGLGGQVPQATLLADYYEEESLGRMITFIPAMTQAASIFAPLLGGILVSATNWRVGVFVMGCIASLAGLTTFLLREPERGEAERRATGAPKAKTEPLSFGESWRTAKSIHTLRRIWYATPFVVASTAGTLVVVGLYFADVFGLTASQRGATATLMAAAGVIGLIAVGPIAGRLLARSPGRVMAMMGGVMAFQAVGWAILGASNVLALSLIGIVPLGFGFAVMVPLQQMVTLKVVPPRIRGLGYSTLAPWVIVGLAVFSLVLISTPSPRGMVITLIPFQLFGAFLFASGASTVVRDIRAARASVLAEEAVTEAKELGVSKLLVLRGVEVSYEGTQVLFGVDMDLDDGEILALLGTNGAGKSTLLRAIAGVHSASNGAILLDGHDITHEPPHAIASRGVVMMPGGRATFPTLTVEENLRAATWLYRDDDEYIGQRMDEVFDFFPVLRERLGQSAGDLSGGEQQMVGLAQAFLMRPRLLMIDELSLGLAPAVVEKLLTILRAIHQQGTAIILVEQSVNVALTIAKRAVFMEKGDIRFDGETEELLRRPGLIRSVFIGGAVSAKSATTRRPGRRIESIQLANRGLEVQEVNVSFGGVEALQGVSLAALPGEIVGVIGPNGAGKTTLFDVISGFTRPDSGRVMFDGRDVTAMPADARARLGIGRSFQNVRLFPALTVRENIAAALERRSVKNEVMTALWLPRVRASEVKIFQRVDGLIEVLGLEAFADKFASELSTGSRRAVEVACVMAAEPQVLLLDEPSSGLAQAETEELGPVLTRLVRETGCGLLLIEHDIPLITSISQRLVAMDLGRVISTGSTEEVVNDPAVLASYLGQTNQKETETEGRR